MEDTFPIVYNGFTLEQSPERLDACVLYLEKKN